MFESDQIELLNKNITLSSTARPVKVAYFVEDNECANHILDEIFAESYGRWGGIDTLIVPFIKGKMNPSFWPWLLSFDPDYIYSYVNLSDSLIKKIHYKILPAHFAIHHFEKNKPAEQQRLSPRFDVKALSSLSLIPFYNLRGTIFRTRIEAVIDAYPKWEDDGFLGDNFGIASRSTYNRGFPLEQSVTDYVGTYLLTPPDAPKDRWRFPSNPNTTEVLSVSDLLNQIAKKGSIVSVSQLSNALIPGPHPYHNPWPSINIVVGNTFKDRVLFWNSRLLRQNHECDMHLGGLRIPEEKFQDEEFISSLKEFMRWRYNFIGSDSSQKRFTIRSTSLGLKKLGEYTEILKDKTHLFVGFEKISSLNKIVPEADKFPKYGYGYGGRARQAHLQEENRKNFHFKPPYPPHLSEISNIPPSLKAGIWYADTDITRHNNLSFYINVLHSWKLPRREEILRLFMRIPASNSRLEGRINKYGLLTLPCEHAGDRIVINVPEDEAVFRELLSARYPCAYYDARHDKIPNHAYSYIKLSEEGQYLNGALGLFGNLHHAWNTIRERYWRHILLDLCDPKKVIKSSYDNIKAKIKKKVAGKGNSSVTVSTEEEWNIIADTVIYAAFQIRNPQSHISYSKFLDTHRKESEQYYKLHPESLHDGENLESAIQGQVPYLSRDIQDLCSSSIFAQGVVNLCKNCGNRNWFNIGDIKQTLNCPVCKEGFRIPLDHGWDFMLNSFLASCFREHGTMPLIWALGEINYNCKEGFLYSAPLELYQKYPEESHGRDGELDLVCISDGEFIIGEVKRGASDFKESDLKALLVTIKKVRPDKVILACFNHEPDKMKKHVNKLQKLLPKNLDCKIAYICPSSNFEDPSFI